MAGHLRTVTGSLSLYEITKVSNFKERLMLKKYEPSETIQKQITDIKNAL